MKKRIFKSILTFLTAFILCTNLVATTNYMESVPEVHHDYENIPKPKF